MFPPSGPLLVQTGVGVGVFVGVGVGVFVGVGVGVFVGVNVGEGVWAVCVAKMLAAVTVACALRATPEGPHAEMIHMAKTNHTFTTFLCIFVLLAKSSRPTIF